MIRLGVCCKKKTKTGRLINLYRKAHSKVSGNLDLIKMIRLQRELYIVSKENDNLNHFKAFQYNHAPKHIINIDNDHTSEAIDS